jgi:uncharacterized membrane protein YhdT
MPKAKVSPEVEEFVMKEVELKDRYKPFTLVSYILLSIYLLVVGVVAMYVSQGILSWPNFVAIACILGAIFVAIYGGLQVLHVSFIKKHL